MKKIYTLIAFVIFSLGAFAQVPQKMSYQAVVRNASNTLIVNTGVGMRISVLQGSPTGSSVYVETQTPTTNANGLVSIEVGGGSVVSGTFLSINWSTGNYYIKTEVDPTGGTSYTITGASQLLSVPYAMYAGTTAGTLANGSTAGNTPYWNGTSWVTNSSNIFNNGSKVGINTPNPERLLEVHSNTTYSFGQTPSLMLSDNFQKWNLGLGLDPAFRFSIASQDLTERFIIQQTGNVGIGTVNPLAKLDVAGTIKITDGTQGAGKVLTSDANGLATWATPAAIAAYYNLTSNWNGTTPQASAPFTLGNEGTMVTFSIFNNCSQGRVYGGTMLINPTGQVTIINYANVLAGATMSATGNVISLVSGCGTITITLNVTGTSCTMTTGGFVGADTSAKLMVLGI
jgi:hypothetical protein